MKGYEIAQVLSDGAASDGIIDHSDILAMLSYLKRNRRTAQVVLIDDISCPARNLLRAPQTGPETDFCGPPGQSPAIRI